MHIIILRLQLKLLHLILSYYHQFCLKTEGFFNISWVSTGEPYLSETLEKGVPARAKVVIWYQFWTPRGPFWLKKGKEVRKRFAKTLGFHIQNGHRSAFCWGQISFFVFWRLKIDPDSLWNPLGGLERFQTQILVENFDQTGAKIDPKFVKNRPKIEKIPIPKPTLNSIQFFDRFLINFEAKMRSNFDQILR